MKTNLTGWDFQIIPPFTYHFLPQEKILVKNKQNTITCNDASMPPSIQPSSHPSILLTILGLFTIDICLSKATFQILAAIRHKTVWYHPQWLYKTIRFEARAMWPETHVFFCVFLFTCVPFFLFFFCCCCWDLQKHYPFIVQHIKINQIRTSSSSSNLKCFPVDPFFLFKLLVLLLLLLQ